MEDGAGAMSSPRIRSLHRGLAIAFTLAAIANFFAPEQGNALLWLRLAALVPLALLMLSGLVLFAMPYVARRRAAPAGRASASS
jgi:hypothetical protein